MIDRRYQWVGYGKPLRHPEYVGTICTVFLWPRTRKGCPHSIGVRFHDGKMTVTSRRGIRRIR